MIGLTVGAWGRAWQGTAVKQGPRKQGCDRGRNCRPGLLYESLLVHTQAGTPACATAWLPRKYVQATRSM